MRTIVDACTSAYIAGKIASYYQQLHERVYLQAARDLMNSITFSSQCTRAVTCQLEERIMRRAGSIHWSPAGVAFGRRGNDQDL
jgi:hypothetical protein